jgi:DNA-binding NarL/FixJ family response regulator
MGIKASKNSELGTGEEIWSKRLFKNTYTRGGKSIRLGGWCVKIQYQSRRHTFSLGQVDKESAAIEAKAIYETILQEGWDVAFQKERQKTAYSKTDKRYWRERLILRRYRFPALEEPENVYTVRIEHAGKDYFFPLGTSDLDEASRCASDIYCCLVKHGWEHTLREFPRELIVAFEWCANPIMWTYTTVHTLVGRISNIATDRRASGKNTRKVLIVESDAGLRNALAWCINRQPEFMAIHCESPENFAEFAMLHDPALILLNRSLAERMGIAFSGGLTSLSTGSLALTYSVSVDGDHMFVSTPGGAEAYMLKRVDPERVLDPILESGLFPAALSIDCLAPVKKFFRSLLQPQKGEAAARLSPRENEVLMLLSKGRADKEIAEAMGISVWTVHGPVKRIFERLGVRTRTEAVVRYLEK